MIEEPGEVEETVETLDEVDGSISLQDVCFSYDPKKKLIEDFTLDVKPARESPS